MPITSRKAAPAAVLAGALLLGACASTPPPDDAMAQAKMALQRAEASEAPRAAPVELQQARTKLTEAEKAIVAENYGDARRLAQESAADAQYAEARAANVVAQRNRQQVDSAIGAIVPNATGTTATQPLGTMPPATTIRPMAPPAGGGMQSGGGMQ